MALKFLVRAALFVMLSLVASIAVAKTTDSCLPSGIHPTDAVSSQGKPGRKITTVTVAQTLKALNARCRRGKLVAAGGREIRFYQLVGCWGNPPDDYQEQLARQQKELARLRRRYHVIEMTCDPSGNLRMRSSAPPAVPKPYGPKRA
jgi:hypothetical protein